ncbi:MAG: hypothetical protein Q7U66_14540 [Methylobacter sp.]|nr:hypothetical protein [Methylobacter sp.]
MKMKILSLWNVTARAFFNRKANFEATKASFGLQKMWIMSSKPALKFTYDFKQHVL